MIFQIIQNDCGISTAIRKQGLATIQNSDGVLARLYLRMVRTKSCVSYMLCNSDWIESSHRTRIQIHSNYGAKNLPKIQEQVLAYLVCILGSVCMVFATSDSLPHEVPPV